MSCSVDSLCPCTRNMLCAQYHQRCIIDVVYRQQWWTECVFRERPPLLPLLAALRSERASSSMSGLSLWCCRWHTRRAHFTSSRSRLDSRSVAQTKHIRDTRRTPHAAREESVPHRTHPLSPHQTASIIVPGTSANAASDASDSVAAPRWVAALRNGWRRRLRDHLRHVRREAAVHLRAAPCGGRALQRRTAIRWARC